MQLWEYASLLSEGPASKDTLNELGDQGWELVSLIQGRDSGNILYVFKRPKQASSDSAASAAMV